MSASPRTRSRPASRPPRRQGPRSARSSRWPTPWRTREHVPMRPLCPRGGTVSSTRSEPPRRRRAGGDAPGRDRRPPRSRPRRERGFRGGAHAPSGAPEATAAPVAVATAAVATGAAGSNAERDGRGRSPRRTPPSPPAGTTKAIAGFRAIIAESATRRPPVRPRQRVLPRRPARRGRFSGTSALASSPRRCRRQANLRPSPARREPPTRGEPHWLRFAAGASVSSLAILASVARSSSRPRRRPRRAIARAGLREAERPPARGVTSAIAAGIVVAVSAALLCATRLRDLRRAVVLSGRRPRPPGRPYDAATASGSLDPGEIVVIDQRHQEYALVRSAGGSLGLGPRLGGPADPPGLTLSGRIQHVF